MVVLSRVSYLYKIIQYVLQYSHVNVATSNRMPFYSIHGPGTSTDDQLEKEWGSLETGVLLPRVTAQHDCSEPVYDLLPRG
jgi:hypothetical protein